MDRDENLKGLQGLAAYSSQGEDLRRKKEREEDEFCEDCIWGPFEEELCKGWRAPHNLCTAE